MTVQEAIRLLHQRNIESTSANHDSAASMPLQSKESILESTDQDGWISFNVKISPSSGMTSIDLALSSGYKSLASRLGQWTYTDTRTLVSFYFS